MDYVETISVRDVGTWHGKELKTGGIFTGKVSMKEQMVQTQMDYEVEKNPSYVLLRDGTYWLDEDRFSIMRPPVQWSNRWERLRVAADRYQPLQNMRIAEILDPIQEEWPLETMGVLKGGKVIFAELKMDSFDVAGHPNEQHNTFLLLVNDHEKNAVRWGTTVVRVVCANTYAQARANNKALATIPHTGDVESELLFRSAVIDHTIKQRKLQQDALNYLFTRKISKDELAQVIESTIVDPKPSRSLELAKSVPDTADPDDDIFSYMIRKGKKAQETLDRQQARADMLRMELAGAYNLFNDQYPYAAGTGYALWNAGTYVFTHSESFTGTPEKNMVSLLVGQKSQMNHQMWDALGKLK